VNSCFGESETFQDVGRGARNGLCYQPAPQSNSWKLFEHVLVSIFLHLKAADGAQSVCVGTMLDKMKV